MQIPGLENNRGAQALQEAIARRRSQKGEATEGASSSGGDRAAAAQPTAELDRAREAGHVTNELAGLAEQTLAAESALDELDQVVRELRDATADVPDGPESTERREDLLESLEDAAAVLSEGASGFAQSFEEPIMPPIERPLEALDPFDRLRQAAADARSAPQDQAVAKSREAAAVAEVALDSVREGVSHRDDAVRQAAAGLADAAKAALGDRKPEEIRDAIVSEGVGAGVVHRADESLLTRVETPEVRA